MLRAMSEPIPPEAFLADYPDGIRATAEALRAVVRRAVPDAVERVRAGWRLIGYDVPAGRGRRYFAFVAPEPGHVHLGFEYGAWMADPDRVLEGAHLRLRKVRYLTFGPRQPVHAHQLEALTREAALVAAMSPAEREARVVEPV
jgi:hypothetical protein